MYFPIAFFLVACFFITDAAAGTARLRVSNPDVAEGNGPDTTPLDFVITRSGDTGSAVTLRYRTADGTAIAPDDYTAIPETVVMLGPGQTRTTITVAVRGDTVVEGDETLFLRLTGIDSVVGAPSFAATAFDAGSGASSIVATDIDGDGLADLAVANASSDSVSLFFNTTAAGATAATYANAGTFVAGSGASALTAADINGDGLADLAVTHADSDSISVFFNTTDAGATTASYADAGTFVAGSGASALTAGDINGDGLADLAVTHSESDSISVFFNTTAAGATTASYADAGTFVAGSGASALTALDINDDGLADLAVTDAASEHVAVFFNATAPGAAVATYADGGTFDIDSAGGAIATLDADGDGVADLAVADADNDSVGVFLNRTPPGAVVATFDDVGSFDPGRVAHSLSAADFNQDGMPDLAATQAGDSGAVILLNQAAAFDDSEGIGTLQNDDATPPNSFSFVDQADVPLDQQITSAAVRITGISGEAPISVEGGRYSIGCTSSFASSSDTVRNGQTVCVRHTSSTSFATATDTILTVGGVTDTFTSITLERDTRPDPFKFNDAENALLNAPQVSNTVTITGINAIAPVSVEGGEYSIGCTSTFTSQPGTISRNQTVCVRHTSSGVAGRATDTTLTVGDVSDTFTSITPTPNPRAYDAGALGMLDLLAGLLAALINLASPKPKKKKPVRAVALANGFQPASGSSSALER